MKAPLQPYIKSTEHIISFPFPKFRSLEASNPNFFPRSILRLQTHFLKLNRTDGPKERGGLITQLWLCLISENERRNSNLRTNGTKGTVAEMEWRRNHAFRSAGVVARIARLVRPVISYSVVFYAPATYACLCTHPPSPARRTHPNPQVITPL